MQQELEVLDDDKVLFKGLLYTISVTDKRYNQNGLLFLPTESGTKSYKNKILETSTFLERLMIMKSALVDERIPSSVVHEWVEEYHYPCGQADIYHYEEHFGRDWMMLQQQDFKHFILQVQHLL